jgi:tetratricopeptide (TPR) repeat protein
MQSNDSEFSLNQLKKLVQDGKFEDALKFSERMRLSRPVISLRGQALHELGRYQDAITCYAGIKSPHPIDTRRLADSHFKAGNIDKARRLFDQLPQHDDQMLLNYALFEKEQNDFRKARGLLEKIRAHNPTSNMALGHCSFMLGEPREALHYYNKITKPNEKTLRGIAQCYAALGEHEIAGQLFEEIPDKNKDTIISYARYYREKRKDPEHALVLLEDIKPEERDASVLIAIGVCLHDLDRSREAIRFYQEALNLGPNKTALLGIAECHRRLKEEDKAIAILTSEPLKDYELALLELAYCYQLTLRPNQAIDAIVKIPDWRSKRQALKTLAQTYELMGQRFHPDAIHYCHKIKDWEQDINVVGIVYRCSTLEQRAKDPVLQQPPIIDADYHNALLLIRYQQYSNALELLKYFKEDDAALEYKGICHYKLHQHGEAIEYLERIRVKRRGVLHRLGKAYQYVGDTDLAIATHEKIIGDDDYVRISKARCYVDDGQFDRALELFRAIEQPNMESKISLNHCYMEMADFESAIKTLENEPPAPRTSVALACSYARQGSYDKALAILRDVKAEIPAVAFTKARCYIEIGKFNEALAEYEAIRPIASDNEDLSLGLAICHEKMGRPDLAIQLLEAMPVQSEKVKLNLACSYLAIGNYDKGIDLHHRIRYKTKKVIKSLAIGYMKIDMYREAIETVESYPGWERIHELLLVMANIHITKGEAKPALELIERVSDWKTKHNCLLAAGKALMAGRDYEAALNYLEMVERADPQVQYRIAVCYEKLKQPQQAVATIKKTIAKFPVFQYGYYYYGILKLAHQDEDSLVWAEQCLKTFPFNPDFYVLKAKVLFSKEQYKSATQTLEDALRIFPFNLELHLTLLKFCFSSGQYEKAQEFYQRCLKLFRGSPRVSSTLGVIVVASALMPHIGKAFPESKTIAQQIKLPQEISDTFDLVYSAYDQAYIVGSSVLTALEGGKIEVDQDIDVVGLTDNLGHLSALLKDRGVSQNPHNMNLFNTKLNSGHTVDCYGISLPIPNSCFVKSSAIIRDFTICCLYLNHFGHVFDPSGKGLADFSAKTLRPLFEPNEVFREDPIKVLRAIKYIVRGYKPVKELEQALFDWQPGNNFPTAHFNAVLKKLLYLPNAMQLLDALRSYGILQKVYRITPLQIDEKALDELRTLLSGSHHSVSFWTSFGAGYPTYPAGGNSADASVEPAHKSERKGRRLSAHLEGAYVRSEIGLEGKKENLEKDLKKSRVTHREDRGTRISAVLPILLLKNKGTDQDKVGKKPRGEESASPGAVKSLPELPVELIEERRESQSFARQPMRD